MVIACFPADIVERISALDREIRDPSPKCALCNRPDGGILRHGETAFEVGLVDRARCPRSTCPMRDAHGGILLTLGAGEPAEQPR
jgi:hypothetical protein